jgi:tetratricopeptide (TPR) repeat protein
MGLSVPHRSSLPLLWLGLMVSTTAQSPVAKPVEDAFAGRVEGARQSRDEAQLNSLKAEFEKRVAEKACDARCYYEFARVESFLADVGDLKKDKKQGQTAIERGIETAQHSLQLDDKSADAHALLADLFGHRIAYGGMFAGAKFGPKVKDEVAKAMAIDDKNPRVWASNGRSLLMTPKMFGGDVPKAIGSFEKSLELDGTQAETWSWLGRAYKKQGDAVKASEATQKALQLEPQNPMMKATANEISHSH